MIPHKNKFSTLGLPLALVGALGASDATGSVRSDTFDAVEMRSKFSDDKETLIPESSMLSKEQKEELLLRVSTWIQCDLIVRGYLTRESKAKRSLEGLLESIQTEMGLEIFDVSGGVHEVNEDTILLVLKFHFFAPGSNQSEWFQKVLPLKRVHLPRLRALLEDSCIKCDIPDLPFKQSSRN